MTPAAIIFDFDGVLIESEYGGNRHLAATLTTLGHPISDEESMIRFTGLAGAHFREALEAHIGGPIPSRFAEMRAIEDERAYQEGYDALPGAIAFVRALPADLPIAVASSSSVRWIARHLDLIGLRDRFGTHLYSGQQHVARGKPAPDLYLYAAQQLGAPIADTLIVEDSPIGVRGATASGGHVVGLCAGRHCGIGHADRLRAEGATEVVAGFDALAERLRLRLTEPAGSTAD